MAERARVSEAQRRRTAFLSTVAFLSAGAGVDSQRGANVLLTNLIAITAALVLAAFGVGAYLNFVQSQQVQQAQQTLRGLAARYEAVLKATQTAPSAADTWDSTTFFGNTTYFPTPPASPLGGAPYFTYYVSNSREFMVLDNNFVAPRFLSGLPKATWTGSWYAPGGVCGNTCSRFVYMSNYGMMGL